MLHVQTANLVEDLKVYELPTTSPKSPGDKSEFRRSMIAAGATSTPSAAAVSTMLETAMEELFVPYTEGQRYLERESKSLGTLYTTLLTTFARYHVCICCRGAVRYLTTPPTGTNTQGQILNV